MALPRLFGHKPNALRLEEIPALTSGEFQQRENETQFERPDAEYRTDWKSAQADARLHWQAMGVTPRG